MAGSLEDHNAIRELTSNYSSAASAKDDAAALVDGADDLLLRHGVSRSLAVSTFSEG